MSIRRFIIMQLVWAVAVLVARAVRPDFGVGGEAYLLRMLEMAGFVALPILLNAFIWRRGDQWLLRQLKREDRATRLSRRQSTHTAQAKSAPAAAETDVQESLSRLQ